MTWEPVFEKVKRVPRGRVVTYGQLARSVKLRGGARAAGRAMAACPQGRAIPWHRVVGAGGRILLREPFASLQRKLLESEKVQFRGTAVDLTRHEFELPGTHHRAARPLKNKRKSKTPRSHRQK